MQKSWTVVIALSCLLAWCAPCASAAETHQGTTMRIRQEILLGDLNATTDYQASFLPPDRFRVEGIMHLKTMEMQIKTTIVGAGQMVRQLSETPFGVQAMTVDLNRIRKALPELDYAPSRTYDPSVYRDMLKDAPDKKPLDAETLDGAATEGFELSLPGGRMSLPANVSLGLPEPAKARIWINPRDGIARRVELLDANGRTFLKTHYTDVKTGVPLPAELFELKFPDGATTTDITDIVLGGVAATRQPLPNTKPETGADKQPQTTEPRVK